MTIDPLGIRKKLGRESWSAPRMHTIEGANGHGFFYLRLNGQQQILVSEAPFDGVDYLHASIAGKDQMPSYHDLTMLHKAVFGGRYAYQVFAPKAHHVNIHPFALHLWGRSDGKNVLPEFGAGGSI
jgi:hypothetical protein